MKEQEERCSAAVAEALRVIDGKWAFSVISQLYYGNQRFNQLRKNIGRVSVKALTDCLRQLERLRVVQRRVYPTVPVSVEYSLTEKGKEYRSVLMQMREWGEKWTEQLPR